MNTDFMLIFLDYWKIQDRYNKSLILYFPLIIVFICFLNCLERKEDLFSRMLPSTAGFLMPVLALILAALVFVSNWAKNKDIREFDTGRKLLGKSISLYKY